MSDDVEPSGADEILQGAAEEGPALTPGELPDDEHGPTLAEGTGTAPDEPAGG